MIKATAKHTAAFKPNIAFYAGFGSGGLDGLAKTSAYIHKYYPDHLILADCKRSEMGESVKMVKQEIFDWLGADCVMVTPWFGFDTVADYFDDPTKGVCIYVHDSNPTAKEFQELKLKSGEYLYEYVAKRVVKHWNTNGQVFIEVGATYPKAMKKVREIVGEEMVILTAGVGAQGAQLSDLHPSVFGKNGSRLLVNSSRGIIFAGEGEKTAKDYFSAVSQAAKILRDQLAYLSAAVFRL